MASDFVERTRGFGGNLVSHLKNTSMPTDWKCVCGQENSGRSRYTRRGREICRRCLQERSFVEDHEA